MTNRNLVCWLSSAVLFSFRNWCCVCDGQSVQTFREQQIHWMFPPFSIWTDGDLHGIMALCEGRICPSCFALRLWHWNGRALYLGAANPWNFSHLREKERSGDGGWPCVQKLCYMHQMLATWIKASVYGVFNLHTIFGFHNTAINVFVIACSGVAVGGLMFIIFACVCFQVEFEDASQLVLKRGELWTEDEDLPKYVKSRLVSQTVMWRHTWFHYHIACFWVLCMACK